ncbi:S-adenosylmethionine-dependent nucleotide dehydratase RSAD2 isoform X2 [Myotis daubentonii]|uniref:S-adenosylmethionine-dependent nucleotide dehydratase RSAD2 isoform X2 n=1 Tax=Myotis daubentonii TaxID=98922 RepID=UPI0028735996|nr:S-adenosylmethionine-dependent nucleotide dehydratase RSAD2 isoform X2 [Myotis daubentonii]
MWATAPLAFPWKLLGALWGPLGSLWGSLAPLLLWLRAALRLGLGWTHRGQGRRDGPEPQGAGEEEEGGGGPDGPLTPTSVNYHFTRQCNYKCGFCFHTAKTSFVLPLEEAQRGLRLLKEAGMEKVNFSGGEPFLQDRGEYLGRLVRFCKQELRLPSVSIVSNGSLIRERWFVKYGQYLDILAISCDSFNEDVNVLIGRGQGRLNHVENLRKLRRWCREYRVAFKINSVINRFNVDEDMRAHIQELNPVRWKEVARARPCPSRSNVHSPRFVLQSDPCQLLERLKFKDTLSLVGCRLRSPDSSLGWSFSFPDDAVLTMD